MYTSDLGGCVVIDDSNADQYIQQIVDPESPFQGGYEPRDYEGFGITRPYTGRIIPRSEWAERIQEQDRLKITPDDHRIAGRCRILNQQRTNYCWCFGTVGAMQVAYAQQGGYVPELSAASAAAKIKGYQNVGGWAGEALKYIDNYGVATLNHWPEAVIDRKYDTATMRANALMHRTVPRLGYEELDSQSFDHVVSAILQGWPVTLGLMWWGHLVFGTKVVVLGRNDYGVKIINSWGDRWENGGTAVLREEKCRPHEGIAIKNVTVVGV